MAEGMTYARQVISPHRAAAEDTAAILQEAAHGGAPLIIPGAREARVSRPGVHAADHSVLHRPTDALSARQRLDYEREGGGAPSERRPVSRRTLIARVRHWLFRRERVSVVRTEIVAPLVEP